MKTHKISHTLKTLLILSLALTAPLTACDDEDEPVAGAEAGHEGGHHAGHEGGHDAGHEGGHDAGHEGGHDAGHEGGHEAGVMMAGTEAGVMMAGTEAGVMMAGTEGGVMMAGTEGGVMMAGTEAGMSMSGDAFNELDEAGRRTHCEGQVEALFVLLPADEMERAAYITQSCTMSGLFAANEAACTQELASCTEGFETLDLESAITECMTDEIFNTCTAPVAEVAECQIAQTTFYANMIQGLDLTALSCADAGDYFGDLGALLTQLMPAPADLCTPAANACFTE